MTCVSWNDAEAYIEWLDTATGRRFRLPTMGLDPLELEPGCAADDPLARATVSDTVRRLLRAILELPESQREALLLKRFGGLSYRGLAATDRRPADRPAHPRPGPPGAGVR